MSEFFLNIVNMSISASWIVLAVLLLRLLLKKAPKWINGILWGIVGLRLIMPFSFESIFSLIPSRETISKAPDSPRPHFESGVTIIDNQVNDYLGEHYYEGVTRPTGHFADITTILAIVWIVGIVLLLAYTIISYSRVKNKIGTAVLLRDNIYQSENVVSPFVLGIIRPKIYLPFNINEQDMEHVIAHEQAHINRKDHWWKPLGFLILTLHWFNPLMWLGYVLLCRDIELACDEKVIKELNTEQKADYSQALLTCSVNRRMIAACPIAFGEVGVKDRVKSILNYKKPAFWIIVVAIIASVAVAVCFLTNPTSNKLKDIENRTLNSITEETVVVWVSDGETYHSIGAISMDLLEDLSDIKISRKEVSLNRSEDRDASHTLVLQTKQDTDPTVYSYLKGLYIYFNSDFSSVWVNDGVKPTLSYKVINPEKAKEIFEHIKNYNVSEPAIGGVDSTNVHSFESTVSYANWAEASEIYFESLNKDKMAISSVLHLPIYRFDTLNDLEQFKRTFGDTFTMDGSWDEVPSFNNATAKYDSAFFEDNSLMLIYVSANNSTHRFKVHSIGYDEKSFCVHIAETTNAEEVDTAMAGWFVTVAVSDELIMNCTEFDADLNNGIELLNKADSKDQTATHYPNHLELYEVTPSEDIQAKYDKEEFVYQKLHYKATDGTWSCEGYTYKYRLEITGRLSNAAKNITYIVLSNSKDITFEQTWKASGLSSLTSDYFEPKDSVIVGHKLFS